MSEATLKELNVKRSSIKGRLTKFRNFLHSFESIKSPSEVEMTKLTIQLGKIESLGSIFDELQSQIEVLNASEMDDELEERDAIELEFATLVATGQQYQTRHSRGNNVTDVNSSSSHCCQEQTGIGFKPPTIQIAKFDGSYYKWLEFRDLYCSLVHDNKRIPTPIKFCYLNSYVEGEAARVISNLEVTEANYDKAWDLLRERYDNKRLLVKSHLNALLNFEIKSSETDKALRQIVDTLNKNLRALTSLGEPTSFWDTIIVHIVSSKLPSQTSMKWEEFRNSIEGSPTVEQFNQFLKDRADVLESYNHSRTTSNLTSDFNGKKRRSQSVMAARVVTDTQGKSNVTCDACNGSHRIYDCEVFKSKSVDQRQALVNSLKLCRNCLRSGHSAYFCRSGTCRKCKGRHNTMVCSNNQKPVPQTNVESTFSNSAKASNDLTVNVAKHDRKDLFAHALLDRRCLFKNCGVATLVGMSQCLRTFSELGKTCEQN
ncbi:uncharacterized protein LOC128198975 [Bicyclus anynana]|uniref:Uncharacterized protein LOC128198975 n=1 Tax=Bicyclus anynana TaxID=110368 RepID=A0ABM3LVC2_BICAN|nr:uncharacterized protein LOC128198975 [Bicyclus anynana]